MISSLFYIGVGFVIHSFVFVPKWDRLVLDTWAKLWTAVKTKLSSSTTTTS